MSLDDCVQLGDEKCRGDCSSFTASCENCAPRPGQSQSQAEENQQVTTYFGSPVDAGIWPPNPFRPRPADAPAVALA
jgi:hypothetical protein